MRRKTDPRLRGFARTMRNEPTDAEAVFWDIVRGRRLEGLRFRRQHPIDGFIVDFICLEANMIVEIDGSQHAGSIADEARDKRFQQLGYKVLRFWNADVLTNPDGVAQKILHHAGKNRM